MYQLYFIKTPYKHMERGVYWFWKSNTKVLTRSGGVTSICYHKPFKSSNAIRCKHY